MTILTLWFEGDASPLLAGIVGLGWGFAPDRLAARWPEHEGGSIRAIDWRTLVVVTFGALAFGGTVARFHAGPVDPLVVGIYVAALVVLFATDLDQRLLPDIITLPLIGFALVVYAAGASPFLAGLEDFAWAAGAAVVVPLALYLLAIPFGRGAIGQGDRELLV